MLTTFSGISEDGHKEEGRTVEASQGEIRHQHRSTKVNVFCIFILDCLKPMNDHHYPFFFLTNSECCDFLFEIQKDLLETLIYFRIYYVNKLVAFCKTCQCFLLKFLLLYYTRKKIIKQHLNRIKNCSVVGGPRDWVSWGWGPFDILNASSDQYSA